MALSPIELVDVWAMGTKFNNNHHYSGGALYSTAPVYSNNYGYHQAGVNHGGGSHGSYGNEYNETDDKNKELRIIAEKDDLETIILESIIVKGIKDVPCLMDVYKKLGGSETMQSLLQNFKDGIGLNYKFKATDLKFFHKNDFSSLPQDYWTAGAYTFPSHNGDFTYDINIVFNTDKNKPGFILDKPSIIKSYVFIHEILHAEMFRYLIENKGQYPNSGIGFPDNMDEQELIYQASIGNKSYIFNSFVNAVSGNEGIHHELMATKYRSLLMDALSEVQGGQKLKLNELNAISWIGLEGTKAFEKQITQNSNFKNKLYEIYVQILNNYTNDCG